MGRITVIIVVLATLHASCDGDVSKSEKKAILDKHNKLRGGVTPAATDMMKLRWDNELARVAEEWVETCPSGHDSNGERKKKVGLGMSVGQNIAWGYSSWDKAIQGWYNEVNEFTYGVGRKTDKSVIGHFTQMTYSKTSRVGCAYKNCPDTKYKRYYVCNYAYQQSGAVMKKPWTSGTVCSDCKTCSNNLCDCGTRFCYNGGKLDPSTCKCSCPGVFSGPTCEKKVCVPDPSYCREQQPYGYPADTCTKWSNVPNECPNMCGICP